MGDRKQTLTSPAGLRGPYQAHSPSLIISGSMPCTLSAHALPCCWVYLTCCCCYSFCIPCCHSLLTCRPCFIGQPRMNEDQQLSGNLTGLLWQIGMAASSSLIQSPETRYQIHLSSLQMVIVGQRSPNFLSQCNKSSFFFIYIYYFCSFKEPCVLCRMNLLRMLYFEHCYSMWKPPDTVAGEHSLSAVS